MARRSSSTGKGRSLREKRREARPREDQQISEARKRLRTLEDAQDRRDKALGDYQAADARLGEMEHHDRERQARAAKVAQDYLNAFAVTVAWRFLSECLATGRYGELGGDFDGRAYAAARTAVVRDYLINRFGAASGVSPAMIFRAVEVCSTRLTNYMVTRALRVTKAQHDAAGYSHLKWCDEPEAVVKAAILERKKADQRTKGNAARRAAGRPTKQERSAASISRLMELFDASKQSIYNWASLGTLTVKFDGLTVVVPQKNRTELRARCVRLEADMKAKADAKAGRASSPTPPMVLPDRTDAAPAATSPEPNLPVIITEPEAMLVEQRTTNMTNMELASLIGSAVHQGIVSATEQIESQRRATEAARAERDRKIKAAMSELTAWRAWQFHHATAWAALEQDVTVERIAAVFDAMGDAGVRAPARPYDRDKVVSLLKGDTTPAQIAATMLGRPVALAVPT